MIEIHLDKNLENQIKEYCEVNEIHDVEAFAIRCLKQGFNIVRYGLSPLDNINRENKGIKDFEEDDSKKEPSAEDSGKQKEPKRSRNKPAEKEKSESVEEKKPVKVRKIQIIKKG